MPGLGSPARRVRPTTPTSAPRIDATIVHSLRRRGTGIEAEREESSEQLENRIGTALMALYRDTRDPEAFETLYRVTAPGVRQWIVSLLGRDAGAVDPAEILQDTFVNVYRYPGAFREDHCGSFRVWVRTIAGNVVRRGSSRRPRSRLQELDDSPELEDPARGPVQSIEEQDESERLRRAWILFLHLYAEAWKHLGQRDRRTLHLVEVEGLSYREAGQILAVGSSNMKMIVFRSRRRLARRIRQAMGRVPGCVEPRAG